MSHIDAILPRIRFALGTALLVAITSCADNDTPTSSRAADVGGQAGRPAAPGGSGGAGGRAGVGGSAASRQSQLPIAPVEGRVAPDPSLPNVVFILADDLGYNDVGAYSEVASPGADTAGVIRTPNLDRLAARGMMFTDAHTPNGLCAPNRFSLLTGSNPWRNGRPGGSWGLSSSSAFIAGVGRTGDAGKHLALGSIMQAAGYVTAFLGKAHLGGTVFDAEGNPRQKQPREEESHLLAMDFSRPLEGTIADQGFDYALSLEDGIQGPPYAFFENAMFKPFDSSMPADNTSVKLWGRKGGNAVGNNGVSAFAHVPFLADVAYDSSQVGIRLATTAATFIDDHLNGENADRPFFLYCASQAIHWPHTPPLDFDGDPSQLDQPVAGETPGPTSDMIYELDLQVGTILDKLEAQGLLASTLIIFTSDNGGLEEPNVGSAEHDTTGVLRGYKATIYEGGHRVPFIAAWGDATKEGSRIEPGTTSNALIGAHDWVATMYELTQQSMGAGQAMDSISLLPLLTGEVPINQAPRAFMLHRQDEKDRPNLTGIRDGDYFLICETSAQIATELYDLAADLGQATNLIHDASQASRIQQMRTKLLEYNNGSDTDLSEPRSTEAYIAP